MLAAALIALHCGSHADLTGTLTLVDRTEVRLRTYQGEAQPGVDAVNTPGAIFTLLGPQFGFSLGYYPSLTLADIELGLEPQVFQTLSTALSWRATRHLRLSLGEDGSYGTYNSTYLTPTAASATVPGAPPTGPTTLQLLPNAATIHYASSRSWASFDWQVARHLVITLAPSYFVGGGLDAASRATVPLQTRPRAELDIAAVLDSRDTFRSTLAVTDSVFDPFPCDPTTGAAPTAASLALTPNATCAPRNLLFEAAETWRRRLTRVDDLSLSAGATVAHIQLDPGGERDVVFPTGAATLVHHLPDHGDLTADVRVGPIIDVRFGIVDERGQARVAYKWILDRTTFVAGAGFMQSLPPSEASSATFVGADGEARYALGTDKRFEIGGGDRGAWQQQAPYGAFFSNVVYAMFIYHEPTRRLWP